jgi:hypothetical protein
MGDRQGKPSAVNLGPFVGMDFKLWPTVVNHLRCGIDVKPINNNKDIDCFTSSYEICGVIVTPEECTERVSSCDRITQSSVLRANEETNSCIIRKQTRIHA